MTCDRTSYQGLPSLGAFVPIERDEVGVDVYTRQGDAWSLRVFTAPAGHVVLEAIGAALPLTAIDDGTSLDPNAAKTAAWS